MYSIKLIKYATNILSIMWRRRIYYLTMLVRWLRHVVRMKDDAPVKRYFDSKPTCEQQNQGRPLIQWKKKDKGVAYVLCSRPRPHPGCSANQKEEEDCRQNY